MAGEDRSWMDNRRVIGARGYTEEYTRGVKYFVEFARSHPECLRDGMIRCPCSNCRNLKVQTDGCIKLHLMKFGFVDNYKRWIFHGEPKIVSRGVVANSVNEQEAMILEEEQPAGMDDMVRDAAGPSFDWTNSEEQPNDDAKSFFRMMDSANEKICLGGEATVLEIVAELLNIKADSNISQHTYNRITSCLKRALPKENKMVSNFYDTKKLVGHIGLGYEKIDCCRNQCMLFYKENEELQSCSVCGLSRYKSPRRGSAKHKRNVPYKQLRYMPLIPRLQRLYASKESSKAMRWHEESSREEGVMTHPSDGEAWKSFDATHTDFAADARNIRLGICSDGFTPFGPAAKSYSCWPVIVTVYNLPPWLCMTDPYMYLSLFIPGPFSPGKNIDVYLRPLIDELNVLWNVGVETWDANKSQNFNMRAAVMWTINDFPAYGMMSGWSTHGRLACPYCMEDTNAFRLENSKKQCWFDCHRRFLPTDHPFRRQKNAFTKNKVEHRQSPPLLNGEEVLQRVSKLPDIRWGRKFSKERVEAFGETHNWTKKSIFWELPYWKTNLLRHNLDIMHIEKNVFDNIVNTVMDFKATKDTPNGRLDLEVICKRENLNLNYVNGKPRKPVAPFVVSKDNKVRVLQWLKDLKLPDGYASNIGNCVNVEEGTMFGLKSHDCHVLLDRLLPIALRDVLPNDIWVALTELSEFFRALTSSTLRVDDMKKLEKSIVVTLCKLEKIFPPSFFDSMEHLPIHLAYEARVD
ncbi:hypothetical protein OROMI_001833 [Orobanche minor]